MNKFKIAIAFFIVINFVGLSLFVLNGRKEEFRARRSAAIYERIIENNEMAKASPPMDGKPDPEVYEALVRLLPTVIKVNINTVDSLRDIVFWSVVLSGLNSLFFVGLLLRPGREW